MATSAALVFAGKSVATPVISFLINKAFNYLDEYRKSEGMEDVKNRLLLALPKIQVVFDVVNPEHIRVQSGALDAWLWQLRDAVEEAEDAIDELEYYELEVKAKDRKVSDWGSSFHKMKHKAVKYVKNVGVLDKTVKRCTHPGTLERLRKAVDRLDKAAAGVADFITIADHLKGAASSSHDRESSSILATSKFVGREKEKEQIIGWLTKTPVESAEIVTRTNGVPIFSVVGHGGMGKTTLAQSICQEDEVVNQFKVIWVTVSNSFDATLLTGKILESVTGKKPCAEHLEALQQDLKKELASVKFLLVLDDVWEEGRINEWEKLFGPLRSGISRGSKILLTTRMADVANNAANVMGVRRDCLILGGLEDVEIIELFNHHVFSGQDSQYCGDLKVIGEKIARKLGGCPLVIKVASGHLCVNMTPDFWNIFLDKDLEHFKGSRDDIMNVLKLSYYHLPTGLQICFRYLSLFPEDHLFDKQKLVQMWMGSGLVSQDANDSLTFEDIGERILAQLTRKSFLDLKSTVYDHRTGKKEYYIMHDLMHELATSVASGECIRITNPTRFRYMKDTVRHICISCIDRISVEDVKKISQCKNLRSLIFDDRSRVCKNTMCTLQTIVESSKSLRLFDSWLRTTFDFSSKFGKLKHLRYICIDKISSKGICGVVKLYHLMVLHCSSDFQGETKHLRCLGNLDRLRYVSYGVGGLGEFPVSRLASIQVLKKYRVQGRPWNQISSIGNLHCLRQLDVEGIENIKNHEEAINAKLNEKRYLSSLSLDWSTCTGERNRADELVLHHLEPHANIRELTISGYKGYNLPFWIEDVTVNNLASLKLANCINLKQLPSLGELALLKHLSLSNLRKLQRIGWSSHMCNSSHGIEQLLSPSLNSLDIRDCPELQEMPLLPPSLISFHIEKVGLTKLPGLGKLCNESPQTKPSQLLHVNVYNCPFLTSLEGSLLGQKHCTGALRTLQIWNCQQLESASLPFEEMYGLIDLHIHNCPNLRTNRAVGVKFLPSSLGYLSMGHCGDLELALLGSLQGLTNLSMLNLVNCSCLVSLPSTDVFSKSLVSLRYMTIRGCENLSSLGGIDSLKSLNCFEISGCGKLAEAASFLNPDAYGGEEEHMVDDPCCSLQIDYLEIDIPSLLLVEPLKSVSHTKRLSIKDAALMESFPERWLLQNRASLLELSIEQTYSLESLPPSMRDLSSLQSLSINGAEKLSSLPDLPSSLQELDISSAGQLRSLPDLPSSLWKLTIEGCHPQQLKKSGEQRSPQWNKIPDIPLVRIGDLYFIMGNKCSRETFDEHRHAISSWVNESKDGQSIREKKRWPEGWTIKMVKKSSLSREFFLT